MANEAIGQIKCPCCASKKARVSVGANGRAYVTCSACHIQMFARSDYSDTLVRANMVPVEKVKAAEAAAPAPVEPAPGEAIAPKVTAAERKPRAPAVEQAPKVEPEPQPAAVPDTAPAKKKSAWDFF